MKRVVSVEQTDRLGVIVPRNEEFWRYPGRKPIRIKMDRDDQKDGLATWRRAEWRSDKSLRKSRNGISDGQQLIFPCS